VQKFKLEDAGKWASLVSIAMTEAAERGLVAAANRTKSHIITDLIPQANPMPVDRGTYKNAWHAEPAHGGAVVYNDSPQASIIEDGARAPNIRIGRKMIDALVEWVKRKGIGGTNKTSKGGLTRIVKATTTEATSIAWAIAKSMQKSGIYEGHGLKIFEKAAKRIPEFIREEVTRELKKEFTK
jgi:hypothetical protein